MHPCHATRPVSTPRTPLGLATEDTLVLAFLAQLLLAVVLEAGVAEALGLLTLHRVDAAVDASVLQVFGEAVRAVTAGFAVVDLLLVALRANAVRPVLRVAGHAQRTRPPRLFHTTVLTPVRWTTPSTQSCFHSTATHRDLA